VAPSEVARTSLAFMVATASNVDRMTRAGSGLLFEKATSSWVNVSLNNVDHRHGKCSFAKKPISQLELKTFALQFVRIFSNQTG